MLLATNTERSCSLHMISPVFSNAAALLACLALAGCMTNESVLPRSEIAPEQNAPPSNVLSPTAPELMRKGEDAPTEPQDIEAQRVSVESKIDVQPADMWARMRSGFTLPRETDRKRVFNELRWYVNHPEYVARVARRAGPHLHYIIGELERREVPLEFALLPIVESAYDPFAYSHGRAAGLWQFIPGTARVYGLKIDWWQDSRRDVRASTTAAIDYLEYLHKMFDGDWLLALAAYNAGQGNVLNSIRRSNLPKDEVDFWSIEVLKETYTYVPRLLAISEIFANPEKYHITLPDMEDKPYWEVVETGGQLDLHKAAVMAGISDEELYTLNPAFNQWATHPEGPHELLIPISQAAQFRDALTDLPATERLSWKRHKIRYGESLGSIAKKYRTTVDTIRSANEISGNTIRAGESLLIPAASPNVDYTMTSKGRLAARQASLENKYGAEPAIYIVQPGDSLWEISRKFDVGMRELAKWNGMGTTGLLHPGTELKIFKHNKSQVTGVAKPMRNRQVRRLNYEVRSGESLSKIASKFNVSVQNIGAWNKKVDGQKYIHPGDRLTLYVDVTQLIN